MTMQNYGKVWHLDHCLAVSTFNLLDENEVRKCLNWINLRPMYVRDNIIKGNKIDYVVIYVSKRMKGKYFRKLNEPRSKIKISRSLSMKYTSEHLKRTMKPTKLS